MATSVLGDLKSVYHRTWWALMLRGVLGLVVGLYILARPLDSVAAFALVIAFWALFAGSVEIVQAIELKAMMKHWWVVLLAGLVGVAFGIAALFYYPGLSLTFAVVMVSWWLTLTGILGISAAVLPDLRGRDGILVAHVDRHPRHLRRGYAEEPWRAVGVDCGVRRAERRRGTVRIARAPCHARRNHGTDRRICDRLRGRVRCRRVQAPLRDPSVGDDQDRRLTWA